MACRPAEAGFDSFDLRLSIAAVAEDGPFSDFPGIDRRLWLLDGAGVTCLMAQGFWRTTPC
ncbi:MAG: HutD family protein [Rhodobacterales bacterium]|nr:HutD family protein [Rhodobacterales bacterium]